jgi:hypothetical protein
MRCVNPVAVWAADYKGSRLAQSNDLPPAKRYD